LDCVKQYRDWENQHRPWFKQLIIGISAHANMNDNDQAILAGMDGFKSKPISFDQLKELQNCDAAVERSRTLDQIDYCSSSTKPTNCGGTVQPVTLGESYSMAATHDVSLNDSHGQSSDRVCLIASASLLCYTSQLAPLLEANGFKIMFANNGIEARGLLQLRNWDVVLIDDDLPKLSGAACVKTFRRWEQQNRVNGQKNIFFVCDGNIPSPSDKTSLVQPPDGFNGVLRKPVPWDDLQYLIGENRGNDRFNIVVRC
jgi:CheY-like chemotaxis protein